MLTAVLGFFLIRFVSARSEQGRQRAVQRREVADVVAQYRADFLLGTRRALGSDRTKWGTDWASDKWISQFTMAVWRIAASLPKADRDHIHPKMEALVGAMAAGMGRDYGAAPEASRSDWDAADWVRHLPTDSAEAVRKVSKRGLIVAVRDARDQSGPEYHKKTRDALKAALAGFDELLERVRR